MEGGAVWERAVWARTTATLLSTSLPIRDDPSASKPRTARSLMQDAHPASVAHQSPDYGYHHAAYHHDSILPPQAGG